MDSLNYYDIKTEKANAILRYNQLRKIANLFRFIEILVVLVLISRLSFHVPVAVKKSGGFFRDFSGVLSSPRFVFVLGNVIVITLFAKSGKFTGRDSGKKFPGYDLYDEFVSNSEKNQKIFRQKVENRAKQSFSENPVVVAAPKCVDQSMEIKSYTRSHSEILERPKKPNRALKRSETENFGKKIESSKRSAKCLYPEDAMSSDEFRLKVEAFIARQQRFRMEEEYSGDAFE